MADHSPTKLSPTADDFTPGAGGSPAAMKVPVTNSKGELQFTRSELLVQKEEISTVRSNDSNNKYGGNNKNHGGIQKFKGKPFKPYKNKPQYRDQPAFYMDEETLSTMCDAKRKALGDGMKLICVGCGVFAKYGTNPSHNWSSIMETDYSSYLTSPLCPHLGRPKKLHGDRLAEKQTDQSETPGNRQTALLENSGNTVKSAKQDRETQTQTQTELTASPPTKAKSRPTSLMISGWQYMIPIELQNVLDNTPENYENEYKAHFHIKSAITMFDEFASEYEAVMRENQVLKAKLGDMHVEGQGELQAKVGDMSIESKGERKEVDAKNSKEYLGYFIDE